MRIKKSLLNIGKAPYTVIEFNYKPPKDKNLENNVKDTVDVKCPEKFILFLNRKNTSLVNDNLKVNLFTITYNKFYILSPGTEGFHFEINDEVFDSSSIKSQLTPNDVLNLFYALALEEYCKGNSIQALDILTICLKDKYLIKSVLNAFTSKERQACTEVLQRSAHNRKIKLGPKLWAKARLLEGQLEEHELVNDPLCFMDLLEIFEKNGDIFVPVPADKYRRIGKKVVDHYNAFKRDEAIKLLGNFKDLVFTKDRLNISVRYEISGFVTVNPKQAKAAGFKTNKFKAKIFREQTIIKDGEINIEKFQAYITKETLEYIWSLEMQDVFKVAEKNEYSLPGYTLIYMDISKIPVLNRSYISKNDKLDYILDICQAQKAAECKQKIINYFLSKQVKPFIGESLQYTKEQYELLKFFGLDSKGVYHGIDNKLDTEIHDEYKFRLFEFNLKGFSSLPKVETVMSKVMEGNKKLNGPESIIALYLDTLKENKLDKNANELIKLLEEQKAIIKSATRILAQIKLIKALTGTWWQGLKMDTKDNYLYERADNTLIIKVIRKYENEFQHARTIVCAALTDS
jgi:hypothetical protein